MISAVNTNTQQRTAGGGTNASNASDCSLDEQVKSTVALHDLAGLASILRRGGNANCVVSNGFQRYSVLHDAAATGQIDAVRLLVGFGAALNSRVQFLTPSSAATNTLSPTVRRRAFTAAELNVNPRVNDVHVGNADLPVQVALRNGNRDVANVLSVAMNLSSQSFQTHTAAGQQMSSYAPKFSPKQQPSAPAAPEPVRNVLASAVPVNGIQQDAINIKESRLFRVWVPALSA